MLSRRRRRRRGSFLRNTAILGKGAAIRADQECPHSAVVVMTAVERRYTTLRVLEQPKEADVGSGRG